MSCVSRFVSSNLNCPVVAVVDRNACTPGTVMSMPKAPVDEDHFATARKRYIRISGDVFAMKTESKAEAMYKRSNRQFRLCILRRDRPHRGGAIRINLLPHPRRPRLRLKLLRLRLDNASVRATGDVGLG